MKSILQLFITGAFFLSPFSYAEEVTNWLDQKGKSIFAGSVYLECDLFGLIQGPEKRYQPSDSLIESLSGASQYDREDFLLLLNRYKTGRLSLAAKELPLGAQIQETSRHQERELNLMITHEFDGDTLGDRVTLEISRGGFKDCEFKAKNENSKFYQTEFQLSCKAYGHIKEEKRPRIEVVTQNGIANIKRFSDGKLIYETSGTCTLSGIQAKKTAQ